MATRAWTTQRAGTAGHQWTNPSSDASSPWYDGGTQTAYADYPGSNPATNLDTVTIAHAITLEAGATVTLGTSGAAGTNALATSSSGTRTFTLNGTLNLAGDFNHAAAGGDNQLIMGPGSQLNFLPTATVQYVWKLPDNRAYIVVNGTSGSHAQISTSYANGGAAARNAWMNCGSNRQCALISATYLDVVNMGTTSNYGIYMSLGYLGDSGYACPVDGSWTNVTFTGSNAQILQVFAWDHNLTVDTVSFASSIARSSTFTPMFAVTFTASRTSGTRVINNCAIDGVFLPTRVSVTNTFFGAMPIPQSIDAGATAADFAGNCISFNQQTTYGPFGSVKNCYFLNAYALGNPEPMDFVDNTYDILVDGCIWDAPNATTTTGHCLTPPTNATNAHTFTAQRCLAVVNGTPAGYGHLLSCSNQHGTSKTTVYAYHNTVMSDSIPGAIVSMGESGTPLAGKWPAIQGNLAVGTASQGTSFGTIIDDISNSGPADCVLVATNNAAHNRSVYGTVHCASSTDDTTHTDYYDITTSLAAPLPNTDGTHTIGVGDLHNVDPVFVYKSDSYGGLTAVPRNAISFAVYKGLSASGDSAASKIAAVNTYLAASPSTRIAELETWVRNGYRPTAVAYSGAGIATDPITTDANGNAWGGGTTGDIGAMAYQSTGNRIRAVICTTGD